ncbi:G-protein coupled receptor 183 [Trichoplax sp. H2]|nr:G-protein coupled receptor 183 [Trichoplax sp. H2]|eukprot:RDD36130.1 G-protein coupled receptor 183 [Trichoplax sp. H2]
MNNSTSSSSALLSMAAGMTAVSIFGIIGNFLLLLVIIRSKKLLDPTYLFIINVAASDLTTSIQVFVVNFFSLTNIPLSNFAWSIFCKVLSFVYYASLLTSSFSLALISLYRLKMVSDPIHFRSTSFIYKHRSKWMIAIWTVSFSISIPGFPLTTYNSDFKTCMTGSSFDPILNQTFYAVVMIVGYVIPAIVMLFCYVKIFRKLLSRVKQAEHNNNRSQINRSLNAVKFMVVTSSVYMILILPFGIFMAGITQVNTTQFDSSTTNSPLSVAFTYITGVGYLKCLINPILFLFFDKNIRSNLVRILPIKNYS